MQYHIVLHCTDILLYRFQLDNNILGFSYMHLFQMAPCPVGYSDVPLVSPKTNNVPFGSTPKTNIFQQPLELLELLELSELQIWNSVNIELN